jgi:hypothetical protein
MKHRIVATLAAAVAFMGPAGVAFAAWMAPAGSGKGLANGYTLTAPGTGSVGTPTLTTLPLSWVPSSGLPSAGGYQVLRGTTSGGPYTAVASGTCHGTIHGTACTDSGLSADTTYYYEVEAVIAPWVGPANSEFSGTTDAADGSGTMTVGPTTASAGSTGNNLTFTFIASSGSFGAGSSMTLAVPTGSGTAWTVPQTTTTGNPGFTTTTAGTCTPGTLTVSASTITVPMACAAGTSFAINYTDATAQANTGTATFTTQTKEGAGGTTLTSVPTQPTVVVSNVPSGSGTMTVSPSAVVVNSTGNNLTFTFTATSGSFGSNSAVTLAVPTGSGTAWTVPQKITSGNPGFTTITAGTCTPGTLTVSASTITVPMACGAGTSFAINYANAAAPTSTGTSTFTTQTREGSGGTFANISIQPVVTVNSLPTASSLTLAKKGGGTAGLAQQGDTITVVFNQTMAVSSFCASWSGNASNQSLTGVSFTMTRSGNSAAMLTTGTNTNLCGTGQSFNFGSIDMGDSGYQTKNATTTFANSSVAYTAATNTLVITLGSVSGGPPLTDTSASNPAILTPSASITNAGGTAITGTVSTATDTQWS